MSQHKFRTLSREIIALSQANNWDEARLEWKVDRIEIADDPHTCLCTHWPILELCFLSNDVTGNRTMVGNVCVKKFLGLDSDAMFAAVRRIAGDITRAMNPDLIVHAYSNGWINDWEKQFYLNTWRKRALSYRVSLSRVAINRKVLRRIRSAPLAV